MIPRGRAFAPKGTERGYMRKRTAIAVAIMSLLALVLSHFGKYATEAAAAAEPNYAVTADPYLPVHNLESVY
jgi:hypothetical protein